MRRARTSSVGSASASGADSSQHNASTSASDVEASQHSASYQQQQAQQQQQQQAQQQQQQQQQGGLIMRMRSRGASITQVRLRFWEVVDRVGGGDDEYGNG